MVLYGNYMTTKVDFVKNFGVIAWVFCALIFITSVDKCRRQYFNFFFYGHYSFLSFGSPSTPTSPHVVPSSLGPCSYMEAIASGA
jgi:hypothetical protein